MLLPQRYEFSSKSQPSSDRWLCLAGCCCYRKGTNFQANHNGYAQGLVASEVVVATAKVRIFKQITTLFKCTKKATKLLLLPQRYEFSSKSQQIRDRLILTICCCCYRKGTNFQASHNTLLM